MALPDTADAPDTASEKPWEMFARKKPWELFAKAAPATPAATPALDQDIAAQKQLAEGTRQFHQTYEQYAEENPTETQRKLARLAPLADTPAKQYQLGRLAADRLVPELPVGGVVGDLVRGGSVGPFHTLRDIEVSPEQRQKKKELLATIPPDLAPPLTKTQKFLAGAGESVGNTEDFLLSPVGVLTLFGSSASIIPKAVQRVISFAFAAQMASQLPETATALTQELQKPEKERDYEKIGNLVTTGASGTLFSAVAAAHGLRVQPEWQGPAPRGDVLPMPPGAQPPPVNPQVPPPRSQAAPPPVDPAARPAPAPLAPSVPSVSSTPVEAPAPSLPPERQREVEAVGKEMGFVFDGASPGSRTTGPLLTFTLSGLPKDDPAHGAGFTTKFTDSADQIRAKAQAKIDAFRPGADPAAPSRAGDQPASTAGAPAPPAGQPTTPNKPPAAEEQTHSSGAKFINVKTKSGRDTKRWVQTTHGLRVGDKYDEGMAVKIVSSKNDASGKLPDEFTIKEVGEILGPNEVELRRRDMTPEEIAAKRAAAEKENALRAELGLPAEPIKSPEPSVPSDSSAPSVPRGTEPEQFKLFEPPKEKPADAQIVQLRRMMETADRLYGEFVHNPRAAAIAGKLGTLEQEKLKSAFGGAAPETPTEPPAAPEPPVTAPAQEDKPAQPESPIPNAEPPVKTFDRSNVPKYTDVSQPGLKVQKQFLLAAVDQAIRELKPLKWTPAQVRLMEEGKGISNEFERRSRSGYTPDAHQENLNRKANAWTARMKAQLPYVTFDVPGDGVFHILQSADALSEFRTIVQKEFPTGKGTASKPSMGRITATPTPALVENPDLAAIVKAVANHASEDETRKPLLNTIYSNGKEIVTTDGRRVIRVVFNGPGTIENPVRIDATTGKAEPWDEKRNGTYPEYGAVEVPLKERRFIGTADTETLWRDVLRAEFTTNERSNSIKLYKNPDGSFGTASHAPELGESAHNVHEGAQIVGAYNSQYLRDALQAARNLGNAKVDIYSKDTLAPLVFRGKNYEEHLMPMRLGDERGTPTAIKSDAKPAHPEPLPATLTTKWQDKRIQSLVQNKESQVNDLTDELKRTVYARDRQRLSEQLAEAKKELAAAKRVLKKQSAKSTGGSTAGVSESRIDRPSAGDRDPFTMDEGDLADLLEEQYGEPGATGKAGEFGRSGQFTFPSFDAFAKWMDERYAERDHEGMRLAFAEADTANKIRYIKENRGANDHKKAWLTNLATGADLPKVDPPVARTTPRPMPGGRSQPPPPRGPGGGAAPPPRPGPQARPAGPPPPPRKPSLHRKFDITALTQFFRLVGKHPTMNSRLKRAYGRFIEGPNVVQLKSRLLWDTKLAERVLGHEIGHFIDLAIPVLGKGKRFAERIRPLFDFKNQIGKKKELRNDARDLSRDWRGDFHNGDTYRDSAEELFADFLSAMFNKPEWVNQKYPRLYDAFQELRDAKPQFKSAYREIETWLQGDTVVRELADQDKAAIEKTVEIVTEKKEKSAATYADRINFGMMSLWQRAFQKEGKPRQIGSSVTESLEASYMWAAKRLALWHDEFLKTVQPLLNQVSGDPVQARAHLLSYSKAVRTIGERRAAGVWIEQNPQQARELLTRVLRLDPTLYSKFADALSGAKDRQLYDLAASIFREIHDRKAKYVERIARQIDDMHMGVDGQAALMAFNVRGKLLNPGGLTPETSAKMLDHLRDALGPDKFDHLEKAAAGLRDLMFAVQKEMADSGLISKKIWNELIAPNQDNYLPYAVLDYFDGHVRAGVMPQKGTALDVADVVTSTQLKVSSAFLWLQRQRQVQLLRDAYARGGATLPLGEELERASDLKRHQVENGHDATSRAVIWADGKPHLMEFPGDPGKMLQEALALPEFYSHIEWMHTASKWSHQLMQYYTQFNPRFLLYRNIIRGFRTAGLKVGFGAAFQQMRPEQFKHNLALARNYADAAFGGEMLPEVRQLVNLEALPAPHLAAGSVVDLPNMRELIVQGALPAFSAKHLRGDLAEKRGPISAAAQAAKNVTDKLFTTYEAFEKIYNYNAAIAKGLDPATAAAIAKRGGIPRPGVSGKWSGPAELFFPWTRVKLQGYRATYDMLRDPRFRKAFLARFMVSEALPRLAKVAIGAGLIAKTISWATGSPRKKDDDDGVMAEVFKRISPYKMALDDVVPTMLYDPRTGKYHYFWEYNKGSQIPKHFEVVSIRIPSSEEGQVWGTMLYNAMVSVPGINEKLSTPGQGPIENMGNWAINSLSPQLSPAITTGANLETMVLQGRNPQDSFKGQPAANQQLFDAGGAKRLEAITGYTLNSAGGPGELSGAIAANANILDPRALDSLKSRLSTDTRPWSEKIPFLGAAVSHDNYAQYRTDKLVEVEEKKLRANARLIMPDDVRSLYDFYYLNLARQKNLTASERVQFDASKHFVEKIWGNLSVKGEPNPDSFYAKAAHAVGPDGSAQAKATLTRDLQQAAAIDIATFKHARRTN